MLTRLDDGLISHDKLEDAAERIGRHGYERALGGAVWGIAYANLKLTDGFLAAVKVDKRISPQTVSALVASGLWDAVEGGYQIHDFLDYNPSAESVKSKQKRDRERKRIHAGFRDASTRNPDGIHVDSIGSHIHARAGAPTTGQDRTGEGSGSLEGEKLQRPAALMRPAPKNAVFAGVFVVPDWLDGEFERKSGWSYDVRMAWYRALNAEWEGRQIGEPDPAFLRKRFEERIGATAKASSVRAPAAKVDPVWRQECWRLQHQPPCQAEELHTLRCRREAAGAA